MFKTIAALCLMATPALADLTVCNETDDQASVAIGYIDNDVWTSEGWWTMRAGDCTTIFSGNLKHRYYYWRASTPNGPLPSEDYSFCTSPQEFTIRGDENCAARGYESAQFTEVDTGQATDYVIVLEYQNAEDDDWQGEYNEIYGALQGLWRDAGDPDFKMLVQGGALIDTFAGVEGGRAIWDLSDTCPGANGAGPVMLVKYTDIEDVLCWVLLGLNENELAFRAIGATTDIYMYREN